MIRALTVLVLSVLPAFASAGLEDGRAALERGDYLSAEREFRPLAEQGNMDAQLNLGLMYEMGWGAQRNLERAENWYRKAAEKGFHFAQDSLGSLNYGSGQYDLAMSWFLKAAKQDNASAQNNIGLIHSKGHGFGQDYVQPYKWYTISSEAELVGYGVVERKNLGIIAKKMTDAQVAEAKAQAPEWLNQHRKK